MSLVKIAQSERLDLIKNFSHTQSIPHDEIIFHISRGESLHIRSEAGEWLKSYSWNWDKPTCYDWVNKTNIPCCISDIPLIGNQVINGERVVVRFYKIGDLPVFKSLPSVLAYKEAA